MPEATKIRTAKSQIGTQASEYGATYQQADSDITFAVGQMAFIRIPTEVPKGAIINSAFLTFNMVAKDGNITQQCRNQIRAHNSSDSEPLVVGVNEWGRRPRMSRTVNWWPNWTATTSTDPVFNTADVTNIVQDLVFKPDFQTGGYITFMITTTDEQGSDLGFRANNDFAPAPKLYIKWQWPVDSETYTIQQPPDEHHTINLCENSEYKPGVPATGFGAETSQPYWQQNPIYGAFVDPANYGAAVVDSSFVRAAGVNSLRFTAGPPPAVEDAAKRTGLLYTMEDYTGSRYMMFAGWVYIPSSIAQNQSFRVGDAFRGGGYDIVERDQWVPFCTTPVVGDSPPGEWNSWWFTIGFNNYTQGQQFWLSEPSIFTGTFRQMPFNGDTPDRGPNQLIKHVSSSGSQQSSRIWTPRRKLIINNTLRAIPTWIKRSDGIHQVVEPIRGGSPISAMADTIANQSPASTIGELP